MGTRFTMPLRILQGQTIVMLAPAPTLTTEAVAATEHLVTVAVGDAYRLAPHARAIYHSDANWWVEHWPKIAKSHPNTLKLSQDPGVPFREVCIMLSTGERGFDPDPSFLRDGNNSGYACLSAFAHTRPARVILLGFDMHQRNGAHFFGEHPRGLRKTEPHAFARWIRNFREVRGEYEHMGIDIVNCSPDSDLAAFRKSTLAEELK